VIVVTSLLPVVVRRIDSIDHADARRLSIVFHRERGKSLTIASITGAKPLGPELADTQRKGNRPARRSLDGQAQQGASSAEAA
jgi:hypothetical protein